jgi:hypothetical protein
MRILGSLFFAVACQGLCACEDVRFTENPLQVDTFQQTPNPTVDILWVVDNSGTMREERQELGAKFDQFMSKMEESGADYHIGVVSTDADDPAHSGNLQGDPKYISNATSNAKDAFIHNVDLAETENRREKGLDAMRLAFSADLLAGRNSGFLREEAALFVIVISDEDDSSIGATRYYARWLDHLKEKGNENLVSLSAIVGTEGCENVTSFGDRYIEVQEMTNGLFYSICTPDYGPMVEALGIKAAGLRRKFYLSQYPREDTLRVLAYSDGDPACQRMDECSGETICAAGHRCAVELQNADDGGVWVWEPEDNAIFFPGDYLPPAGFVIEVAFIRGVK